ncbi:MAG: ABC transporter ATP-binding protein [Sedimenticola sp.]
MADSRARILEVTGVCKRYSKNIPAKRRQLIRQFTRAVMGRPDDSEQLAADEFWALQDVSFALGRGEALGLIGLNGAGKSTLLSIIARQTLPDRGLIRGRGKIAAMINLMAGFEASLTGHENVFLKGALMGRSKREMHDYFDRIVEFAEIGEFIDSPVGTYSSGMRMRLAFSVAVHTDPDLLIIDEVLSVGDFIFRQKCLRKLNELRTDSSFVFVSHSLEELARFCDRLIVLERGRLVFDGAVREGLEFYTKCYRVHEEIMKNTSGGCVAPTISGAPLAVMGSFLHQEDVVSFVSFRWILDEGESCHAIRHKQMLTAEIELKMVSSCCDIIIGMPIWNADAVLVTGISSENSCFQIQPDLRGVVLIHLYIKSLNLNPGSYYPVLSIMKKSEVIYRKPVEPLVVDEVGRKTWGTFTPHVEWRCITKED